MTQWGDHMTTQGFTTDKFAAVRDVLDGQLASGADVGASVAVHHRGEVVVDIWGGWADEARTVRGSPTRWSTCGPRPKP